MARCNCSPRCHVCGDGPCDCTCTAADRKAHLTQPAQAVDVGAIRKVIRSMAQFATPGGLYDYWSRQLTAALPNANGKEGCAALDGHD